MSIFFAIDRYRIGFLGKQEGDAGKTVVLYLFEEGGESFSASIEFHSEERLKERFDHLDSLDRPRGVLPDHLIAPILDVLRHESPVYFTWSEEARQVRLDTGYQSLDDE